MDNVFTRADVQVWEYRAVDIVHTDNKYITHVLLSNGLEGWELVFNLSSNITNMFIFKRPRRIG